MSDKSFGAGRLALTYANDKLMDGAGAQLQRIYGIYAISRRLELSYVHSPLKTIGYQGLAGLERNASDLDLPRRYNDLFRIESDAELPEKYVTHELNNASFATLFRLRLVAARSVDFHVARMLFPYAITDREPKIYRLAQPLSPFLKKASAKFRIALHVRRGEHVALGSARMLPNSYFVACARNLTKVLEELAVPYVCELYTEVPSKAFTVTPKHHGIGGRIAETVEIGPAMNKLCEFDDVPNLVLCANLDPIETLERMATADVLVMSRSSFSYLAAMFNRDGLIIYHPFWHSPMPGWQVVNDEGRFSENSLRDRVALWETDRHSPLRAEPTMAQKSEAGHPPFKSRLSERS